MAERSTRTDEGTLARRLRELGAQVEYPPTPDLARSVRSRLASAPAPRRFVPRLLLAPRRLALIALLIAVIAGALLALSPAARGTVAEWLGLPGLTIVSVPGTPSTISGTPGTPVRTPSVTRTMPAAATPTVGTRATSSETLESTGTPGSIGQRLSLGQPITLEAARGRVVFAVAIPALPELGPPDEVYLAVPPSDGQISLVWRARADLPASGEPGVGLLLSQFRGHLAPGLWQKQVGPDTQIAYLRVNGNNGFWITGGQHTFAYTDPQSGQVRQETTRQIGGSVLLWERGGVTYRLEGARSMDEALRIADSLR